MTETEESSDASAPKHRVAFVLIAAVLLPVLYVLSYGPILWLSVKTGNVENPLFIKFMVVFYAPSNWMFKHNVLYYDFLHAYLGFFGINS